MMLLRKKHQSRRQSLTRHQPAPFQPPTSRWCRRSTEVLEDGERGLGPCACRTVRALTTRKDRRHRDHCAQLQSTSGCTKRPCQ
jgi:hypothetical protein